MPTFYQRQKELAEALKDKLNNLLENDYDIEVNSVDELEDKIKKLSHPYRNLSEVKPCILINLLLLMVGSMLKESKL